ncbi:hypothetical protein J3A83DRAFT_4084820, partial [Scleroderma citrinum]
RRSLRQSIAQSAKAPLPPPPAAAEPDELVLVYPPGTGALNIMRSDLKRLGPEEYLNDTLIEFGLKLWLNDLREKDPALADQIHVFSSFFYKKLNKKNPEEGYQSVRKWTSKVDLFSKKYIIVPINEKWVFELVDYSMLKGVTVCIGILRSYTDLDTRLNRLSHHRPHHQVEPPADKRRSRRRSMSKQGSLSHDHRFKTPRLLARKKATAVLHPKKRPAPRHPA